MPAHRISATKIEAIFQFVQEGSIIFKRSSKTLNITRKTLKKYVADIKHFKNSYPEKSNDFKSYVTNLQLSSPKATTDLLRISLFPKIFEAISINGSNKRL